MRRGRCNNIGLCDNAMRQRTIELPDAQPFVCPKCGGELTPVADRTAKRSAARLAVPLAAIAVAAAAIGYAAWNMYGKPGAPPATQAAAPAGTQTAAAIPPASAQPPAAAPAAPAAPAAVAPPPSQSTASPAQTAPAGTPPPAAQAVIPAADAPKLAAAPPATAAPAAPPPPAQPEAAPLAVLVPPAAPPAQQPAAPPAGNAATAAPTGDQRVHSFLGDATRVPITFTFRSSVVTLTGRSEHDIDRLVGYLRQHHAAGDRVYLAGFTDNQGDPASNEAVAQRRVAAVAAALTQAGVTPGHVASFGSDMPVGDNATQVGRDRNRRVEVYLAPQ